MIIYKGSLGEIILDIGQSLIGAKQVEAVSKAGKVPLDADFKALCDIAESMKTKEK